MSMNKIGGGLGGTRRGGPDVNIKHSGREDNDRERERYQRMERERDDYRRDYRKWKLLMELNARLLKSLQKN